MPNPPNTPKKQVSTLRRQQNVRAQQRYRERQKLRLRALENVVISGGSCTELGEGVANCGLRNVTFNPPAHAAYQSSQNAEGPLCMRNPTSATKNTFMGTADMLKFVEDEIGAVLDDNLKTGLVSDRVTLRDILHAGLNALSPLVTNPPVKSSDERSTISERGGCEPNLRTDQIIAPIITMKVYPTTLPDVYFNCLRLKQFCLAAAFRANAEHLGINFETLINPESESPFHATGDDLDHEANRTGTVRNGTAPFDMELIKPDLRPTASQLRHSHHPWIDVMPCTIFRERFTNMISMDPPMIDEDAICNDIAQGGLICWGSSTGQPDATGAGAPWDIRSWEAQPWFLQKWWFVFGGKEGPLFQQSRWWHELRGDRLQTPW